MSVRAGMLAVALMALVSLVAGQVTAAAAPPDERDRLAIERRAVDARYAQTHAACQTQFFVNDCQETARNQHRMALDGLRQQQLLLDDGRRRGRAADRTLQGQARAQAPSAQASSAVLPQQAGAAGTAVASGAASGAASRAAPVGWPAARPAAHASDAVTGERRHQQAFDQRQQAAREHQRAVEVRNARRDAARQPAGSLPLPAGNLPLPTGNLPRPAGNLPLPAAGPAASARR